MYTTMSVLQTTIILVIIVGFINCSSNDDEVAYLRTRLELLEKEFKNLKKSCNSVGQRDLQGATRLQRIPDVAFSAVLDAHSQDTHTHSEPVKYDHVYTNVGLGYNNNTGMFQVPADGLYQLYASVAVDGDAAIHAFMERNGNTLCAMTATHYSTGSCMVIVHLTEGDIIWVKEVFGTLVRGSKLSTFNGILLGQ